MVALLLFVFFAVSSVMDMLIIHYDNNHGMKSGSSKRIHHKMMTLYESWLVKNYIEFIEKTLLGIVGWGKQTRIIPNVDCGVASFGGYLWDKNILTMSFTPKDEHEAQMQFALEQGSSGSTYKGTLVQKFFSNQLLVTSI
ncbi:hypothetical protein NE237_013242 [Protea cynaroides]|uniref:Methyltransferase n=1 Tax=Protea cynaroides TaxID=273540 RepID=A0A9Q0GZI0_9MAGN|nr:hypothetical protein NE237_013242 [Protea cynaroides]